MTVCGHCIDTVPRFNARDDRFPQRARNRDEFAIEEDDFMPFESAIDIAVACNGVFVPTAGASRAA